MSNNEGKIITKKEAVIAIANAIIENKGQVTTLEIMISLLEAFPDETWILSTISSTMESVRDNYNVYKVGRMYVYRAKGTTQEQPKCVNMSRQYSIIVEDEAIYGNRNILTKVIIALNLPYRFSESHNEFQDITKIPFAHLINIVAKDMEGMSKEELKAYMNTPLFRYYATKV